jgi:uncharacterized protein YceK
MLAICSFTLGGCGTLSDILCGPIDEDPKGAPIMGHALYRGVRFDVEAVKEGGPKVLLAADIPLSAIADTLLIPTVYIPYLAY